MANWSLPTISDLYANVLAYINAKFEDAAKMFDGTGTNLPDGTVRWNSSSAKFEIYDASGSSWSDLASTYAINVDQVDGKDAADLLLKANNLSDLADLATALSNIGLASAAKTDAANVFSETQTALDSELRASATGGDTVRVGASASGGYIIAGTGHLSFNGGGGAGTQSGLRANSGGYGEILHANVSKMAGTVDGVEMSQANDTFDMKSGHIRFNTGHSIANETCIAPFAVEMYNGDSVPITFGMPVSLDTSGTYAVQRADANASGRYPAFGICVEESVAVGSYGLFAVGWAMLWDNAWSFTDCAPVFLSTTTGAMSSSPPSASGAMIQCLGTARSGGLLVFGPDMALAEVA